MAVTASGENPHEESIKVCCRFRPENQLERDHGGKICVEVPEGGNSVHLPGSDHTFVLDRVFRWDANQKEVYDYAAKPIINAVLRGFNGTVFAYGQTSSGKTYTMEGPDIEDKVYQGVIPRMVWSIFDGIYHADEAIEFLVKVSIVEIYNERIRDLLDPKKDNLKVHEDKARGVFIGEVTESYVGKEQEIFDAMRAGTFNRSMAVTNMNEHSSRSHLIFMLTVEQKILTDRSVKVGKLHLVDLAGSEKVAKTGASGERLDEAKNINRSLSALGNVINALTDKKHSHVPYRDSKLSRVLQESLGGNAKTSLIITCSPSNFNEQETISTLRFGQRAKMIKNVVKVNHERSAEELKLLLEKKDLALLEASARSSLLEQLLRAHDIPVPEASGKTASAVAPDPQKGAEVTELQEQIQDMQEQLKTNQEQVAELNRERDELRLLSRSFEERLSDTKLDKEQIEYDRNERADEAERLRQQVQTLRQQMEEQHRSHRSLVAAASADGRGGDKNNGHGLAAASVGAGGVGAPPGAGAGVLAAGGAAGVASVTLPTSGGGGGEAMCRAIASAAMSAGGGDRSGGVGGGASVESGPAPTPHACGSSASTIVGGASVSTNGALALVDGRSTVELDRMREADRPLRRKVSQLDKNLEQLTVMYHKLVAQNSGLKVEVVENDKKIQRKDQRINQLEKNLREAKQKYEKLLTQCANLTSAMDCMGRAKAVDLSAGGNAVRRSNIVRPVRGGVATLMRYDANEVAAGSTPTLGGGGGGYPEEGASASTSASAGQIQVFSQSQRRRESSRTRGKG